VELTSRAALGSAVRAARRSAKLSQQQLADRAGMSRVSLARLETGAGNPTWDTVLRVASVLGMRFEATWQPGRALPNQPALPKRAARGKPMPKGTAKRARSAATVHSTPAPAKTASSSGSWRSTGTAAKKAVPVDLTAVLARTSKR
jgi:transcriptional regulator with XRE-family HTH domain